MDDLDDTEPARVRSRDRQHRLLRGSQFLCLGWLARTQTDGTCRRCGAHAQQHHSEQTPSVVAIGWNAVYAPAGTPKPLIDHVSVAIARAVRTPTIRAKLIELGVEPTGTTPDELAAIIAADTAHWAPVVRAAGFAADGR